MAPVDEHGADPESGGVAEDTPDVVVVGDPAEADGEGRTGRENVGHRALVSPEADREHTTVDGEADDVFHEGGRRDVDGRRTVRENRGEGGDAFVGQEDRFQAEEVLPDGYGQHRLALHDEASAVRSARSRSRTLR